MMRNFAGLLAVAAIIVAPGAALAGPNLKTYAKPANAITTERGVTVFRARPHAWQNVPVSVNTTPDRRETVRIIRIVRADYLAVDTRPRGDRLGRFRFYGNF